MKKIIRKILFYFLPELEQREKWNYYFLESELIVSEFTSMANAAPNFLRIPLVQAKMWGPEDFPEDCKTEIWIKQYTDFDKQTAIYSRWKDKKGDEG